MGCQSLWRSARRTYMGARMMGRLKRWGGAAACGVLMLWHGGCGALIDLLALAEVGVGTHDMAFTAVAGGANPEAQTVGVTCTVPSSAGSLLSDACIANISVDQAWLSVDPASIYGDEDVTVAIDTTGLAVGTYTGNIHAQYELVSLDDEEDIAVTLTVTE